MLLLQNDYTAKKKKKDVDLSVLQMHSYLIFADAVSHLARSNLVWLLHG